MSMSVRDDASGLEYAGARGHRRAVPVVVVAGPAALPADAGRDQALPPRRDRGCSRRDADDATLGEFLDRHGFSELLRRPLHDAAGRRGVVVPPGEALRYPARYLFVFLEHHGMLSVFGSPTWRTVVGGSATYVDAIANRLDEVRSPHPVRSVRRVPDGVRGDRRDRRPATLRRRRHRHPPRPGAADAGRADRRRTSRARRDPYSHQPRPAAHRRVGAADAIAEPARRGTTWSRPTTDGVLVTYDVTRLMRLSGAAPVPGDPRRPRPRRPGDRCSPR